jgi:WD40 repeat protein
MKCHRTGMRRVLWLGVMSVSVLPACSPSVETPQKPSLQPPKLLHTLEGHTEWVNAVAFTPDSKTLVSGSKDNTIKLWEVSSGTNTATFKAGRSVYSVTIHPKESILAAAAGDTIDTWDMSKGETKGRGYFGGILPLHAEYSPDGKTLASAGAGKFINLWDVATGEVANRFPVKEDVIHCLAYSPDGKMLASARQGEVQLWDIASSKSIKSLPMPSTVFAVAFSPDSKTLATSGTDDGNIIIWDVASEKNTATLSGHTADIKCLAFSPDRKTLASGSSDKTIKLWDLSTGKNTATFQVAVVHLAFSPDGKYLASGDYDNKVTVWEMPAAK